MTYANWPIRSSDRVRLEKFLTDLSKGLNKKLGYVDVAELILNHSNQIIDVITAAEAVDNNSGPTKQVVPA